jgi:UDP-glucose 4-epimerase
MENDNLNPYAVTKLAAEDFCMMYWKTFKTPTVALRYFNVYGNRMPSQGQYAPALAIFMKQKSEGKSLTVVGDGLQTRDFVHVSDVVKANLAVAIAPVEDVCGEAYNVGTGKSMPILDIAKLISDNITHIPPRPGESQDTLCDYSKLNNAVGWSPQVELETWLRGR